MDQGAPSPTEVGTDYSVNLILGRREFKRPSKVDTKASVSASVISFGDPYDSPSSLSPSLPYVAESPVDPSPNITSPPGASRQLSRPPSDASLRHPPSIGATHVPKSPLTHWARLRGAVLPGEPPLPVDAEQATGATTPARTAIHAPSIYSLSQQIQQKSSRLARFGKRQQSSASYTSQAAVTDIELAKRFAIDLRKACQSAKLSAAGIDDGTALPGAPAYSQKSPPSTSHVDEHQTFNNANNGVSSKIGLHRGSRRPPSSRSLAAQGTKQVFVPQAGPHQVLTVLEQYSAMPGVSNTLPGESEVLSTLFTPFLRHFASERHAENARVVALEAFDVITLHWRSANSEAEACRACWCIQAAILCNHMSRIRRRVVDMIKTLLQHPHSLRPLLSPLAVQNILQQLLLLRRSSILPSTSGGDPAVDGLIQLVVRCEYARIDEGALSAEYGVHMQSTDDPRNIAKAVFSDGVCRLMRSGSVDMRRWVLQNEVEGFWFSLTEDAATSAPLLRISARQLGNFAGSVISLFDESPAELPHSNPGDAEAVAHLLHNRILVAKHLFRDSNNRRAIIKIVTRLFLSSSTSDYAALLMGSWRMDDVWMEDIRHELREIVDAERPKEMTRLISAVYSGCTAEVKDAIASCVLPRLFERMVREPLPSADEFRGLLQGLAQNHPQLFYRPLFTCAATTKDHVVVDQLRIVVALTRHMPDLLTREADMTAIALVGSGRAILDKGKTKENASAQWAAARPGQLAIILELVLRIEELMKERSSSIKTLPSVSQFFNDLEDRLAVLISTKEQTHLLPMSQRILFSELLYRIRAYTESGHKALWLPSITSWASHASLGSPAAIRDDPFIDQSAPEPRAAISDEVLLEAQHAFDKLATIYSACSAFRRESMQRSSGADVSPDWAPRIKLHHALPRTVPAASLRLLVAISAQLSEEQYTLLMPPLWNHYLEEASRHIAAPASFLLMQCAERIPRRMKHLIEGDLISPFTVARHHVLSRLSILFSWRFDVSMQRFLSDRRYGRPFRNAGKPLSFVPTEVGLQRHSESTNDDSPLLSLAASLPPDIRRGLMELDWYQNETEKENEKKVRWDRLPLSALPMTTLNIVEYERALEVSGRSRDGSMSPSLSPTTGIISPKSGKGVSGGARRRSIFVPLMASIVASLPALTADADPFIAISCRDLLFVAARDDPALACRPLFEALEDISSPASEVAARVHAIINLQAALPPTLSYYVFNHLAGYLKAASRDMVNSHQALRSYASVMPDVSRLASHVSDLSVRDLRRNKVDMLVLPTFDLWFRPSLTVGHLPTGPARDGPEPAERDLEAIISIRTAQNMFLWNFLRRFPKEAPSVRKGVSSLQLPCASRIARPLGVGDFVVGRLSKFNTPEIALRSLTLAKSYLVLVTQLFRTYSSTTGDRVEIATLIDGINLTVLMHGSDLTVLGMALSAYLTACTRFRRLFVANSGYVSVIPALLRAYSDSYENDDIRAAIEYTIHRFLALHDKAFVFQALDAASQMAAHPGMDTNPRGRDHFTKCVYGLFASLHLPYRLDARDTVGLRSAAQYQEKEALLSLLAEPMEAVLAVGTRMYTQQAEVDQTIPNLQGSIERWHSQRFLLDDLVRLFLTIIAHAPGAKRAENFLGLLDAWTPLLYHGSVSSRNVLQQGIEALGNVISPPSNVTRSGAPVATTPLPTTNSQSLPGIPQAALNDEARGLPASGDPFAMYRTYIHMVVQFSKSGGHIAFSTQQRAFDGIKVLLQDHGAADGEIASSLVLESARRCMVREGRPTSKQLIGFFGEVGQLFRAHGDVFDVSSIVESVTKLLKDPVLSTDRDFTLAIVDQFCKPAIEACSAAAAIGGLDTWSAREAVSALFAVAFSIPNSNAINLVIQQTPNAAYLAGFVLPLCNRLATSERVAVQANHALPRLTDQAVVWGRLLGFVMDVCLVAATGEQHRATPPLDEMSTRVKSSPLRERLATMAVTLQIMKVIVLRAEGEVEQGIPGLWPRLGRFIREVLIEGDLAFAVSGSVQSPTGSPSHSRTSSPAPESYNRLSQSSDPHTSSVEYGSRRRVRAIDYMLASIIHFTIMYRSPLIIQLRLWIQEHILRATLPIITSRKVSRSLSPPSVSPSSSRTLQGTESRRVSSLFTKLRVRHSIHSPDTSPFLAPQEPSAIPNDPFITAERRAGFQMSRPSSLDLGGPSRPIVHLGPVVIQEPPLSSSLDFSEENARENKQSGFVTTSELVLSAFRNIQVVLAWFGYSNDESVAVKAWTRVDGLRAIREETRWLLLEFHESFYGTLDPHAGIPSLASKGL